MTIQHLYPTTRPSLDLNFARTKRLDPRVTFTRGSTATYVGSDGLIKTAASNTARFDHNQTTGESLGLLVEEARTNIVLWNRDLTNAAWTATNVTTVKDQTGIDGASNSASKITASANNGTILQAITSASAARFTTAYVKRLTGTGTVEMTQNGGTTWTAVTVTSSWARVSIPSATITNPSVGFRLTTSGDAIAVDYMQCETGSFSTSAIATTSATVTRSADVASMTGTNFSSWWNASTGTFQANFRATLSGTRPVLSVDDNTANNRIELYTSTSSQKFTVTTSGAAQADITAGTASSTVINSQSAAYGSNDFSTSLNGAAAVTDTSGTIPVVTQLRIGANQAGNTTAVPIARLTYYPTRLTNAQLQALTL